MQIITNTMRDLGSIKLLDDGPRVKVQVAFEFAMLLLFVSHAMSRHEYRESTEDLHSLAVCHSNLGLL